jgi:hypothetical protein
MTSVAVVVCLAACGLVALAGCRGAEQKPAQPQEQKAVQPQEQKPAQPQEKGPQPTEPKPTEKVTGENSVRALAVYPPQAGETWQIRLVGNVKIYCREGWEDSAQKLGAKLDAAIKSTLGRIAIVPQGTVEVTMRPMKLPEGVLPASVVSTDLVKKITTWPMAVSEVGPALFSVDSTYGKQNILSAFSNMCAMEMQLAHPGAKVPVWFASGMGLYLHSRLAADLAGGNADESRKLFSMDYSDKILERYRDKLLKWDFATSSEWAYSAGVAQMFVEIEKKYGAEAIKKIGEGFVKAEKFDRDSLVKIINDATGADLVEFLKKYEAPKYPQLGVGADEAYKGAGLRVAAVTPRSAAVKAGFMAGDIILKGGGKELKSVADLQALVKEKGLGGEVKFAVKRGDKEVELTAVLTEPVFNFPPDPEPPLPAPGKEEKPVS